MNELPECIICGLPVIDQSYACADCGHNLTRELERLGLLAGEARVTISRQARTSTGGQRTEPEAPFPVSFGSAYDHDAAVTVLTTWARHVHEESGRALPTVRTAPCTHVSCADRLRGRVWGPRCAGEPPEHPLAVLAAWLVRQVEWLRHRQEAAEAFDELTDACRLLTKVVDRQPERWYAGDCEFCLMPLYPISGAKVVRCKGCGTEHDIDARKTWLLDKAEDTLAGASWCAATLCRLGVPASASTIWTWAQRGRLTKKGDDAAGRPLYRLGDVRDLVAITANHQRVRRMQAALKDARQAERRRAEPAALTADISGEMVSCM